LIAFFFSGRLSVTVSTPSARSIFRVSTPGDHTQDVGFNPFRQHRRSPVDYVLVAAVFVIAIALLLWAAGVV
jgi:hypothetical protein